MIRKKLALALAIAAILAAAVGAVSASAITYDFTATNTPGGEDVEGSVWVTHINNQIIKFSEESSVTITCKKLSFSSYSASGTLFTVSGVPTYAECTATGGYPVDIEPQGCRLEFTVGNEVSGSGGDKFVGSHTVTCFGGSGPFIIRITNTNFTTKCFAELRPDIIEGATFHNFTTGTPRYVTVTVQHEKTRTVVVSGGTEHCGVANGEHNQGVYEGNLEFEFKDTSSTPQDLKVKVTP